jgi:hypothetical protein
MSTFPKLRVRMPYESPFPREEIYDLEQAEYLVFGRGPGIVVVEGQIVNCYEELKRIAIEKRRKGELVDAVLLPLFDGG